MANEKSQSAADVDPFAEPAETVAPEAAATEQPVPVAADIPAEAEADAPEQMPAEISSELAHPNRASAVGRLEAWAADTRHMLSNLGHEFDGETGEMITYLRAKLLS